MQICPLHLYTFRFRPIKHDMNTLLNCRYFIYTITIYLYSFAKNAIFHYIRNIFKKHINAFFVQGEIF